jgi:hypothetical protein
VTATVEWVQTNSASISGGVISFVIAFLLTWQDYSAKLDADPYTNFVNPISHWKSWCWFCCIATIATTTYVLSLFQNNPFFETISFGQSQPLFRGFFIGLIVVAILKSSFANFRESRQLGIGALYSFIQAKFIQACRRDSQLMRRNVVDSYRTKFRDDNDFPSFLESIVESELRSLPHNEKRKKELREQFDAVKGLLDAADDVGRRNAVYGNMLETCLVFCSIRHMNKLLRRRLENLNLSPTLRRGFVRRITHLFARGSS